VTWSLLLATAAPIDNVPKSLTGTPAGSDAVVVLRKQ
jgi:hypothetical protein